MNLKQVDEMDETQEIVDYLDGLIEKAEKALSDPTNLNKMWWEGYRRAAEKAKDFVEDWMLE